MLKVLHPLAAAAALSLTVAGTAIAGDYDVNKTVTGLAMRGYDPVSYFKVGEPQRGDFSITSIHDGATYRFASEDNKKAFEANPEAYVPQYGGYCAYGLSQGVKVDGDPSLWKIVENKLYLNLSVPVQARWEEDVPGYITAADAKWTDLENVDPAETLN